MAALIGTVFLIGFITTEKSSPGRRPILLLLITAAVIVIVIDENVVVGIVAAAVGVALCRPFEHIDRVCAGRRRQFLVYSFYLFSLDHIGRRCHLTLVALLMQMLSLVIAEHVVKAARIRRQTRRFLLGAMSVIHD